MFMSRDLPSNLAAKLLGAELQIARILRAASRSSIGHGMGSSQSFLGFPLLNQRIVTPLEDDPRKHKWRRRISIHCWPSCHHACWRFRTSAGRHPILSGTILAVLRSLVCKSHIPTTVFDCDKSKRRPAFHILVCRYHLTSRSLTRVPPGGWLRGGIGSVHFAF